MQQTIIKKTIHVASSTLISRFLGIIRELLMVKYLGAGIMSDAFVTAFKIPTSLRKIFAEGAVSAAFIPTFIATLKKNRAEAFSLMSLAFVLFEGVLLLVCGSTMLIAPWLIKWIAPGFSPEQVQATVPLVQILMPFIFFISSSALLAGALQSIDHFFVPAFGPILLNIVFILGLLVCWFFNLNVYYFCFFVLFAGLLLFLHHWYAYYTNHLYFGAISYKTITSFSSILVKFGLCALSMSVMEISLFIDTSFASYLPAGTTSLIYYANRFMGIPLGVFGVAFSTILFPYFSKISMYAPKRLNFYLFEAAKLVFWVTVPCTLLLLAFADKIFLTLFVSQSFTVAQAYEAGSILRAFSIGLFFFSLNKILLNVFYALHDMKTPSYISIGVTILNILLNILLMHFFYSTGLAFATTCASIAQTFSMLFFLNYYFGIHGFKKYFLWFALRYSLQVIIVGVLFIGLYYIITTLLFFLPLPLLNFLLFKIGFWLWVGPLSLFACFLLLFWRKWFKIPLYFLD